MSNHFLGIAITFFFLDTLYKTNLLPITETISAPVLSAIISHASFASKSEFFKTDVFNKVTARINLATGFRAPNLAELASDGTHEGTNRYEIGNINLNIPVKGNLNDPKYKFLKSYFHLIFPLGISYEL